MATRDRLRQVVEWAEQGGTKFIVVDRAWVRELLDAHDALEALAREIAADYPDAADWKDARGRLAEMAAAALAKAGANKGTPA